MRVWMLGSGSAGNAVLVESGDTRILIDAGFPVRELAKRLASIGVSGESIEGAIVTHEHNDHVRGVCAAAKRWKWTVYASTGTIAGYPLLAEICARPFAAGATLELGDLSVQTVRTPHDGTEPVAVRRDGAVDGSARRNRVRPRARARIVPAHLRAARHPRARVQSR